MSKQSNIEVEGVITEALGNSNFKVKLEVSGSEIFCTISGKMRKNYIKVVPGDKVKVEMSPYDLTKGRISSRINEKKVQDTTVQQQQPRKKKK